MKVKDINAAQEEYARLKKVKEVLWIFRKVSWEKICETMVKEIRQDDDCHRLINETIPDAIRATWEVLKKKMEELEV